MVGSVLYKQLYQPWEWKLLQNFVNTCGSDVWAWKLMKVVPSRPSAITSQMLRNIQNLIMSIIMHKTPSIVA
jgi:hypothetical protein